MARTGLSNCNGFYEARRGNRKSTEYSGEVSKLKISSNNRLIQNISRSEDADEDYVEYLKLSYNYDKSSQSYTNEHGNDGRNNEVEVENEDEADPQYKLFLANAKPDGKSYVFNNDSEDELKYEKECDDSEDELKYDKECECDYGGKCLCREKQKYIETQKDAVSEEILLNICRKDELKNRTFPMTDLGYDSNRFMGGVDVMFGPSNPTSTRNNGILSQKLSTGKCGASKRQGKCESKIKSGEEEKKRVVRCTKAPSMHGVRGRDGPQRSIVKGNKPVRATGKRKASDVDENYAVVLEDLQCENWGTKASLRNGCNIEYEAIEDDLEILYDSNDMLKKISKQSKFRQKVMDLLKKPYNTKEYKELWTFVNAQKPVERNMESRRGGVRSYKTNKMGKSYLEYYTDLEEKLKKVDNDERKKLKILRGFLFWLQNLTNKGAFKPWNDTEFFARVAESI